MSLEHYREEHGIDSQSLLQASGAEKKPAENGLAEAAANAGNNGDGAIVKAAKELPANKEKQEELAPRP
jgi:hypothetical protein